MPDAQSASSQIVPRVATFFAIYSDPLGLIDGTYYCLIMSSAQVRGFGTKIALHLKEGHTVWLNPAFHETLFVSVRFHRGIRRWDFIDEHDKDLASVVARVAGRSFPSLVPTPVSMGAPNDDRPQTTDESSPYTVVEMTTPLVSPSGEHWIPCVPNNDVMGPTLTRCIDGLIRIVNSYRHAEKILLPTPSRERLGLTVMASTRPANPDAGSWDAQGHTVLNTFAMFRQPFLRGGENPSKGMIEHMALEAMGHPIAALMSLQADLNSAFACEGNYRGTVLLAHSSSEVLLDTALMGMLYEEGRSPADSLTVFAKPLKTRLLTEYHKRLRGTWDTGGTHPVAVWLRDLLLLRHRVAHAGYSPSSEEAEAARNAHFALGTHLRDRLAINVKKYPLTAGMLVTRGGFDRRNMRSKSVDAALRTNGDETLGKFLAWHAELIRVRA
jgi:hypothetical protein